ncbi:hypothetical protein [Nonomuraea sp. NPDC050202]|uniref:hypothetical protein n=1 Tax=Nonomuraea sp. NPDC050202 TaxID=3155035 RepID=UPI0033F9C98A
MSHDRRVPLAAIFKPAGDRDAVPRIDRITAHVALSDGSTITFDIPQPLSAGIDYRDEPRSCWHHMSLVAPASAMPCRCQTEEELILSIQLNPWRDDGQPAYTVAQQTPERGSSP